MQVSRKRRGRSTEHLVAARLTPLFPLAKAVGSGTPGKDVLDTPGLAIEVKGRRGLDLGAWMKQARKNAGPDELPLLVIRLDGQGEASVDDFPAIVPMGVMMELLEKAGYGNAS